MNKKRLFSLFISLALVFSSNFSIFANENVYTGLNNNISRKSISTLYSDDSYYNKFKDIGFSDEEILELYENEANRLGISLKLPDNLSRKYNIESVDLETYNRHSSISFYSTTTEKPVNHSITINFTDLAYELGLPGGVAATEYLTRKGIEGAVKKSIVRKIVSSAGFQALAAATTIAAVILGGISYFTKGVVIDYTTVYSCDDYDGCKDVVVDMSHRFF